MSFSKKILIIFVLLPLLLGCAKEKARKGARLIMGTVWEITCYGKDDKSCDEAIEKAFEGVERVNGVFSVFDEKSQISNLNKTAGISKVKVSDEVFELIKKSVYFSEMTDGAFDITVLPLMQAWGFMDREPRMPSKEELEEVLNHIGYQKIILDGQKKEISFNDKMLNLYGIHRSSLYGWAFFVLRKDTFIKNGILKFGEKIETSHVQSREL